jgi:hypothetical protein
MNQRIYTVPNFIWSSELESYENSETSQLIVETSGTVVDNIFSGIPFLDKLYEKFVKDAKEKEDQYYENIFEEINKDYVHTQISPYIPEKLLMGQTETAREYEIKFDTGNTQDEIPMYVWFNIYLGDPRAAVPGSFPNKRGKLEKVLVEFILNKDEISRSELNAYFFHGDELKHLNRAQKDVEGTGSNPAIITLGNLKQYKWLSYEKDRVVRAGRGEYILQEIKDSTEKDLFLEVRQFEISRDREEFMQKQKISYPCFF